MSFLDKINDTVNKVTEKTSEAAGVAKVKLDITIKSNSLKELYQALGEELYDYYNDGNTIDERFADQCKKITEIKDEIKAMEDSLGSEE